MSASASNAFSDFFAFAFAFSFGFGFATTSQSPYHTLGAFVLLLFLICLMYIMKSMI